MFRQIIAIYEYIIYIDYASYIDQFSQHFINIDLEDYECVY